jgi:hypothetical protein
LPLAGTNKIDRDKLRQWVAGSALRPMMNEGR